MIVSRRASRYKATRLVVVAEIRDVPANTIDADYRPSEDEPFMNERQREYFRRKLLAWKDDILRESRETLVVLQNDNENLPDLADRASSETDRSIELRSEEHTSEL